MLGIWIWTRPILNWARPILNWAGNNSGPNQNYCYTHNIHLYGNKICLLKNIDRKQDEEEDDDTTNNEQTQTTV